MNRYRFLTLVPALALLGLATSGCALQKLDVPATITALGNAGCKGSLHVAGGAATATGVSAGSAHVENSFDGDCDPSRVKTAAPALATGAVVAPTPAAAPAPPN